MIALALSIKTASVFAQDLLYLRRKIPHDQQA
jgi:hypothetical protein